MLKHKYVTWLFVVIMITIMAIDYNSNIAFCVYLIPIFIVSLIIFYGSYFVNSNYYIDVVCKANTPEKLIAITFDDGPMLGKTDLVLDILKQNNIPATFFCIGKNIETNTELLKRIDHEGHIIGNHSYSHHFLFDMYSSTKMTDELKLTNKLIFNTINKVPNLFRPPYGVTNPNLAMAIKNCYLTPIGWSVRTLDTTSPNQEKLLNKITKNIQPGDVFLFHDTMEVTINSLQNFIDRCHEQGFTIIGLDKLLGIDAYKKL